MKTLRSLRAAFGRARIPLLRAACGRPRIAPLALLALVGCPAISDSQLQDRRDLDHDGYFSADLGGDDCDDLDKAVHPYAGEVCDGVDNDCDGLLNAVDPDAAADEVEWYLDADQDGFGSELVHERSCRVLAGYVHVGGDCDDTDGDEHPGQIWNLDGDGDGFAVEASTRAQCEQPDAYIRVTDGRWDCDDANPIVNPDQSEICAGDLDEDCDGLVDDADPSVVADTWFPDTDRDGWGDAAAGHVTCHPVGADILTGLDCDDAATTVFPGAPDPPYDGVDADCRGDDDYDADGDGHASDDPADNPDLLGVDPDDCDDTRSWVQPGAAEVCNGVPDDCSDPLTWDPGAEAGLVHFSPNGLGGPPPPPVDWTATLESNGVVSLGESGMLGVCGEPSVGPSWTGQVLVTGGSVTILAPSGPDVTVLDSGGLSAPGVVADLTGSPSSPSLVIDGLALVGGTGFFSPFGSSGGCLYAVGLADVQLRDVRLEGCTAAFGGGAYVSAVRFEMQDSELVGNVGTSGYETGGGLKVVTGTLSIVGSTFVGNSAVGDGGALLAMMSGNAATYTVSDSAFDGNSALSYGGAVDVRRATGTPTLTAAHQRATFTGNTASLGAALHNTNLTVRLVDCDVSDNAADYGGGIYATGPVQVEDTAFLDNQASWLGGALYLNNGASTCTSPTAGAGQFRRNTGTAVVVNGSYASTACDYGPVGVNDNTPHDVQAAAIGYSYGTSGTFNCSGGGGCL